MIVGDYLRWVILAISSFCVKAICNDGFHNLLSFKLIGIVDRVCGYVRFEYFMSLLVSIHTVDTSWVNRWMPVDLFIIVIQRDDFLRYG